MAVVVAMIKEIGRPLRDEHGLVHPVLDRALESVEVFVKRRLTVHRLAALIHEVANLRASVALYWAAVTQRRSEGSFAYTGTDPENQPLLLTAVRSRATETLTQIELLQRELENELRENPDDRPVPVWGSAAFDLSDAMRQP
jgi:hypothetical protein